MVINGKNRPVRQGAEEENADVEFSRILNKSLSVFFKNALRISLASPPRAQFFFQTVMRQRKAARIRANWAERGIPVPPIMVLSVTNQCNLHCKGCYNWALRQSSHGEMSDAKLRSVINEASELGISFIVIGGGEPFVRPVILEITFS
jgi:sulfatase maturation enzyme AslB (radical SAM superfamily)